MGERRIGIHEWCSLLLCSVISGLNLVMSSDFSSTSFCDTCMFMHRTQGLPLSSPCKQEVCISSRENRNLDWKGPLVSKQLARLPVLYSLDDKAQMHKFSVNSGEETCSEKGQEVGTQPLLSLAQELVSLPQVPVMFYKEPVSNMQALSWRRKGSLSLVLNLLSFLCCNMQERH